MRPRNARRRQYANHRPITKSRVSIARLKWRRGAVGADAARRREMEIRRHSNGRISMAKKIVKALERMG